MLDEKIILASSSPRRKELLARMGVSFSIDVPDVDEHCEGSPGEVVLALARRKVEAVAARHGGGIVLAADTVVACGGILGKPKDAEDARRMLRKLSGRWHEVYTGVCVMRAGIAHADIALTRVRFTEISEAEIERYVGTGDPMDKAGAYGVQGMAGMFIDRVEGCPHNVMGLPLALTRALLLRAVETKNIR
ncbi:MAG: Maf family protein [Firmicutes bacterium]|nr:Maf family protein [Bacillota bacterium]